MLIRGGSPARNMDFGPQPACNYHEDFAIDHLPPNKRKMAHVIREWLNDRFTANDEDGTPLYPAPALNTAHSGCTLFADTFSFVTGGNPTFHTHECKADLFLVFDGGLLYDFLSPEGDAEYMGGGWNWPLQQFIESRGWTMEDTTSYCISITREG